MFRLIRPNRLVLPNFSARLTLTVSGSGGGIEAVTSVSSSSSTTYLSFATYFATTTAVAKLWRSCGEVVAKLVAKSVRVVPTHADPATSY